MAQVKGKFITLAATLMSLYHKEQTEVDSLMFDQTGKHYNELEPESWYECNWLKLFLDAYIKASASGECALVTFGRRVYPTIKATVGLPTHLKAPLDFIKYEAEEFQLDHKGPDVNPRKFVKIAEGDVIVQAPAPGYHSKLYEGVYLGILELCGIKTGKVVQTRSQEKGDSTSEFHITW